jgi:hypothetical protein
MRALLLRASISWLLQVKEGGWNLIKIGAALIGNLAGGPVGAATAAGLASLCEAAAAEPSIGWVDTGQTD